MALPSWLCVIVAYVAWCCLSWLPRGGLRRPSAEASAPRLQEDAPLPSALPGPASVERSARR
eukprot:9177268-Alexandrium_andersonii.AAC.1